MNDRWHKTVEIAAEAIKTPLPWTRGAMRQAMIQRRVARDSEGRVFDGQEQQRA
ncbi:hypothetical protein [Yoonia sp.]|uniref:hypothetical protein n=1 Tax=Yoonia sp. TaxID=2212373 RepID=UPI0023B7040C